MPQKPWSCTCVGKTHTSHNACCSFRKRELKKAIPRAMNAVAAAALIPFLVEASGTTCQDSVLENLPTSSSPSEELPNMVVTPKKVTQMDLFAAFKVPSPQPQSIVVDHQQVTQALLWFRKWYTIKDPKEKEKRHQEAQKSASILFKTLPIAEIRGFWLYNQMTSAKLIWQTHTPSRVKVL